jgi:spermidine synthase
MTSTPVLEEIAPPRPASSGSRAPLALYALTGFSGLLAEQGFEKYVQLLVGATASASAAVLLACFLGFALGGAAAARLVRQGRVARPLLAYGLVELAVGVSCIAFSYAFHPAMAVLAPLQNLFAGAGLKFQVRFLCGCLLVLPAAALMGASFPLIALALDHTSPIGRKRWTQAYAVNLAGALAGSLAAPFFILPACGLRGALWLCFAIGAGVCAVAARLPDPPPAASAEPPSGPAPISRDIRLLLAASFASGAIFFALEVIWTHLIGVVIGSGIYAFSWMLAAVLLGLLLGAALVNRGARTRRLVRPSRIFQCAALLLLVQFGLWDRAPGFFTLTPPAWLQNSFYFAELFKLYVAILLVAPPAAVLGLIYPRLLASPHLQGEGSAWLTGYLSAANSLGCLSGALLGIFVLVPVAGSEVSLKAIILLLGLFWFLFLRREPLPRGRLLRAAVVAMVLLAPTLGRWWDWGSLTAGKGNDFGQAPTRSAPAAGARYLPPSFVFRQEDVQGGLTTVVEQTILTGEVAHTVRTLFTNGKFQSDDNQDWGAAQAQFGFSAVPSLFVPDYGRALLIGLGAGHGATALRRLGYREIAVAEFAPGIVQAARQCFAGFNEAILDDPRVHLFLEDGRNVLLTDPHHQYDLIAIELASVWLAGATNLYSQEFYQLAHQRLRPGGVLQQWVQLHHVSPREIASELATVRSVFPYVGLWYYGTQGMLVASDRPLALDAARAAALAGRFQTAGGLSAGEAANLVAGLVAARILDPDGVAHLVRDLAPPINTDHNRWIEYATPRYQCSGFDWLGYNLRLLQRYR